MTNSRPNISPRKRLGNDRGTYYGIATAMHKSKADNANWIIAFVLFCIAAAFLLGRSVERANIEQAAIHASEGQQ